MNSPVVFLCQAFHDCPVGSVFTTQLYNFFKENNVPLTRKSQEADIIVINACSIVSGKEKTATDAIKFYRKRFPEKRVVLTGCFDENRVPDAGQTLIPHWRMGEFDSLFNARKPVSSISANILNPGVAGRNYRADYFIIQLSRGCTNNCSYCIEKLISPRVVSRPLKLVMKEFRDGLRRGFRKFLLVADDIGSYGLDRGTGIAELLADMVKTKGRYDISMEAFEPSMLLKQWDSLSEIFRSGKISMINLPLQSGNDRVLRKMNRRYRAAEVLGLVRKIRELSPGTEVFTDIIYSFPSETREEFIESMEAMRHFDFATLNRFDTREGTPAAKMELGISPEELEFRDRFVERIKRNTKNRINPDCSGPSNSPGPRLC